MIRSRTDRRRSARSPLRPTAESLEPRLCMNASATRAQVFLGATQDNPIASPRQLMAEIHGPHHVWAARVVHASVSRSGHAKGAQHRVLHRRPPGYGWESLHEEPGPDRENGNGSPGHGAITRPGLIPGVMFTSWTPPDDNLAVGPDQSDPAKTEVVEAVNEQLGFYRKDGTVINTTSNIGLNTSLFPNPLGGSVFDPRIVFDTDNGGHYLLTALEQSSQSRTAYLDIAASKTSTPATATPNDWYTYRIAIGQKFGSTPTWMDFEGLGFDSQALYVSGNMFGFGNLGSFKGVKIATFDKDAIESGQAVSAPAKTMILTDGAFALQPAVTNGTAPAEYFIESWSPNGSSQVRIHAIQNPLGAGSMTDTSTTVTVPSFGTNVPTAPQLGSTNRIATNDSRMLNAVWSNGSLWAAHTIQNPSTGRATARWYQISTSGLGATLASSGNIDPGNGASTFFPTISTDSSGTAAISYAESSPTEYPSASFAVMPAGAAGFTPASSPNIQAGAASYGGSRWGDYSGVAADPSHPGVFFVSGESTQSNGNWGTWWTTTTPPPPPPPPIAPTLTATAETSGPILLSWTSVTGATGYTVYRNNAVLIQTSGDQTSVENINVTPGTTYTYSVVASTASSGSLQSDPVTAQAATPNTLFSYYTGGTSFPGGSWTTIGGVWSQSTTTNPEQLSQTSTSSGDNSSGSSDKKALINVGGLASSGVIITARVHLDSWRDGELARAGITLFTDPTTGRGYDLLLTGRHSNTGAVNTIANPQVEFLDDMVTWGNALNLATGSQPGYVTPNFQAGPGAPWYWFKLEMRDGVLYGSVWQDGTPEPATWMGSQAGWTTHSTGAPALNGGSAGRFNRVTSNSTASFADVTLTA